MDAQPTVSASRGAGTLPVSLMRPAAQNDLEQPLEELAASIKANGVIQPIVVRALPAGSSQDGVRYEIVAGTVRLAMAQAFAAASSSTDAAGRSGRRAATPSPQRVYGSLVGWDERGNKVPKRAEHRRFIEALCAIEPQIADSPAR